MSTTELNTAFAKLDRADRLWVRAHLADKNFSRARAEGLQIKLAAAIRAAAHYCA